MGSDLEEVKSMLKSVLMSTQEGVRIDRVEADYRMLSGSFLPYRKVGYPNLEAFLRSMPSVVQLVKNARGELMVQAVSDVSTAHIASLVARQRTSKSRTRLKTTYKPTFRYNNQMRSSTHYSRQRFLPNSRPTISPPPWLTPRQRLPLLPPPPPKHNFTQPLLPSRVVSQQPRQTKYHNSFVVPPRFQRQAAAHGRSPSPPPSPPVVTTRTTSPPVERRNLESPITYKQLLEEYAQRKSLGCLVFKTFQLKNSRYYTAKVTVQNQSYGCYPKEFSTKEEAEEEAAKTAVEELGVQLDKKLFKKKVSNDVNSMFLRIREIVESYPNGVIHYQVPVEYFTKHNEDLPDGWLAIVMANEILRFQETCDDRIILYPFDGVNRNESETSSNSDSTSSSADLTDTVAPQLILPNDQYWDVYISHISTASKICTRLLGAEYNEKYVDLATAMDDFYEKEENLQKADVTVGGVYAVKFESSWYRVEVSSIVDGKAAVYFVDHGDNDQCDLDEVYVLSPVFFLLAFQAIECVLSDLEDFDCDTVAAASVFEWAIDKTLIAAVISRSDPISIVLYDTSTDEDVNVNQLLDNKIMDGITTAAVFPNAGIHEAYMSHVSPAGDVFMQLISRGFLLLKELLKMTAAAKSENQLVTECEKGKLYLVKHSKDGDWQRGMVIGVEKDEVTMNLIDCGKQCKVFINDVRELTVTRLTRIPAQCFKCKLHGVPGSSDLEWSPKAVERLLELVPEELPLLLKVTKAGTELESPIVELFKRLPTTEELVSVNTSLAVDTARFTKKPPPPKPEKIKLATGDHGDGFLSVKTLDSPSLPDVNDCFDVHVTLAASPSNFVCQPWMSTFDLEKLTDAMQKYYNSIGNLQSMKPFSIQEGKLYACKHVDDHLWYRAQVKGSNKDATVVSVYYVDFGDTVISTGRDLQPLPLNFHTLPHQALFCKLAGAAPLHDDWRPEDCVRFQSLVVEKEFVGKVNKKWRDDNDTQMIELDLIDTRDPELDISISSILIDEGRARPDT